MVTIKNPIFKNGNDRTVIVVIKLIKKINIASTSSRCNRSLQISERRDINKTTTGNNQQKSIQFLIQ